MSAFAGVDLGATTIRGGLLSARDATCLAETPRDASPDELVDAVTDLVRSVAAKFPLAGVGVAAATYLSADGSTAMLSPNLPFRRFPLRAALEDALGVPVTLENDANAAIWAEARFGAARGAGEVVGLTLGTGVGGAVITEGQLRRGANGFGGELGHIRVVPDGELCGCGLRGCLEQYASGIALARYGRELVAAEGRAAGVLYDLAESDPERVAGPMVSEAARAGDPAALGIFETLGRWLGIGLGSLVNVLDPEVVVIGGGLAAEAPLFLDTTRRVMAEHVTGRDYRAIPPVVVGELGVDAGWRGAADLARDGLDGRELG